MTPEILTSYTDALGQERRSPAWAVDHVRAVLAEPRGEGGYADVLRVRAGEHAGALAGRPLLLDDGTEVVLGDEVPPDLPYGYHRADGDAGTVLVLHAPGRVPTPAHPRGWVLAAQLYATRSATSWGHGDLADAAALARWVAEGGAGGHLMLNPLHAPIPGAHPQPSPYFASTRAFRNPLYLALDEPPPAALAIGATADDRHLHRHAAWAAKHGALVRRWATARADAAIGGRIDRWLTDRMQRAYARWCVDRSLADPVGTSPEALDADGDVRFHAWLQIELEDQLLAAGSSLVHDIAVGTDRAGADAALWPDCYVLDGTRIGCPPDEFNTQGQDWGLPPWHPVGLRAAGHEPFVRAVRCAMTGAAGVRIDHVMGLERLFWIPEQGGPKDGVYVQYPLDELLDVVAIEAHRAGAFVVGEDLGTVPPSIPVALRERGMLSYRIASLDATHPADMPVETMAAITTHDLATTVGLLTGSDLDDQRRLALAPNEAGTVEAVERLRAWAEVPDGAPLEVATIAIHRLLAGSSARLVAATLEDLALQRERPNMPGTIDEWPNWRWTLPTPLEDVLASPLALAVREALAAR